VAGKFGEGAIASWLKLQIFLIFGYLFIKKKVEVK
jgi:hypothetical protein